MLRPQRTRRQAIAIIGVAPFAIGDRAIASPAVGAGSKVSLATFGGGPDVADNTSAMRSAIAELAKGDGGEIVLAAGTHRFASASLGQSGIALRSGIAVRGEGVGRTRLQITGNVACNLFTAVDQSRIAFQAISIVGNSAAPSAGSYGIGAAIRWLLSKAATADVASFVMRDVHLENFRGPYWVDVENASSPGRKLTMRALTLERISFASRPGNSIAPGDVRFNSAAICINGFSGAVRDVRVANLTGDARYIKTGIILYHEVTHANLVAVRIRAAGIAGATDDAGAYAIQLYDSAYRMASVTVSDPVIDAPRSVGIYVAGGQGIRIDNPIISGQTDTRAGTLPKGAIVFNGTRDWQLTGGQLRDNWRDLEIVPAAGAVSGLVSDVQSDGSKNGVSICFLAGHTSAGIAFRNCRWRTTERTVSVQNSHLAIHAGPPPTGGWIDNIVFEDCRFEAGAGFRAMDLWVDSGSTATGYAISRCELVGSNPLYARDQAGSLRIEACTIRDLGTTADASAATLIGCKQLLLRECILQSPGAGGIGINLGGSTGSVRGLTFRDCYRALPEAKAPAQLGRAMPNFVGSKEQYVQNLEPALGEDAGWICVGGEIWMGTKST